MSLRKVLLLTYHFPPSAAVAVYRMLGLVRYLPQYGWQPIVVAPPQVPWEPTDPSLLDLIPPGTPVERVPFAKGFVGKVIRRLAPESHWILQARSAVARMVAQHRPEVVVSSSPPGIIHLLGRWVQKRYQLPWIASFRDPWVTNRIEPHWTLRIGIDRLLERRVMRHATRLVANTPANKTGWAEEYPEYADKMSVITNGFDPERFASAPPFSPSGDRLRVLHAGELYEGRDPRPLLDAWQQLDASGQLNIDAEFVGRVTEGIFHLPTEIQRRRLEHSVKTTGQIAYADSLDRMMKADILLVIHSPKYRLGVPAKLYEYLGAGRPILALTDPGSDIEWVLRESKVLHRCAPTQDVARIRQAFQELAAAIRAGEPVSTDRSAILQFTREKMAQRFSQCLDSLVPNPEALVPTAAVTP